jgi:phosphatidylserine decarboxylase
MRAERWPRLARGTPGWVASFRVVVPAAACLALVTGGRWRRAGLLVAGAGAVVMTFFRDPDRGSVAGGVLAPADGVVSAVDRLADGRARVSTYMRIRDVHVNRAPADGEVSEVAHQPGAHRPAFRKDSERNERMRWRLETARGEIELIQIAGTIARRIVAYHKPGDRVSRGERIGLIRFGSRVDLILPAGLEPSVRQGQRLRAGISVLTRD